jgi:hypothetical protein
MSRFFGLIISSMTPFLDADTGGGAGYGDSGGAASSGTGDANISTGGEGTGSENFKIRTLKDVNPFADDPDPVTDPNPADPNPDPNASDPSKQVGDGETNPTTMIGGKFKDVDSLLTAYQNIQSHSSRVANQNNLLTKQIEELTTKIQSNTNQQPIQPPAGDSSKPDDVSEDDVDLILNNPAEYKKKLTQEILGEIKKQFEPDLKVAQQIRMSQEDEAAWIEKATKIAQAYDPETGESLYPDFFDLKNEIDQAFKMVPQLIQDRNFEGAIKIARLIKQSTNTQTPNPDDYLNDETFLNEKVFTNPQIKDKFLKLHMEDIRKGNPPPQINGNAGGSPPASSPEKTTSLKQASQRLLSRFGIGS